MMKKIHLYDPGVEEYSIYPKNKHDGVICTDVLEHIPEDDILRFQLVNACYECYEKRSKHESCRA